MSVASDARIVSRTEVGPERWDALAEASDDAWLWHIDALPRALETWDGATDRSFAFVQSDGTPVATMPLTAFASTRLRGRLDVAHLLSLGGPAISPAVPEREREPLRAAALEHALTRARSGKGVRLDVTLAPLAPALRGDRCPRVNPLSALGLENTLSQTWIVDLRPGRDVVWRGLRDRARSEIRKAEKAGVEVRSADQPGDLDRYYALHVDNYERTGATPHPRAYFEHIWADLVTTGRALVLFAEVSGEVVAARNYGVFKNAALYWTGAASQRGLEVGGGALVQWRAMEWMFDHGFEWSETGEAFPGSSDAKSRGLSLHKASFGGELYPLYRGRRNIDHRGYEAVVALTRLREAMHPRRHG